MNNEKKYRHIAKFCMKQKADENIAKEYEGCGMKDAMRASRICNRLRWILDPYSKRLVRMTFDVREDEGSNKEAKETVLKYINEGYKARLAFIGDYNYAMDSYGVAVHCRTAEWLLHSRRIMKKSILIIAWFLSFLMGNCCSSARL